MSKKTVQNPIQGIITALVTPFFEGKIDFESLERLLEHQSSGGVDGLVLFGTTGESPTVTKEEKKDVFLFARKNLPSRIALYLGAGTNSTQESVEQASWFDKHLQPDGFLVVTPYYNKPPQEGMRRHFLAVADAVEKPIILYNVPGRTQVSLSADTVLRLAEHPRILALKEASGKMELTQLIHSRAPAHFNILSGDDETWLSLMQNGAKGNISVLSNLLPKEMKDFFEQMQTEATQALENYNSRYLALAKAIFWETNPIPIKAALVMKKIIRSDELRLPLVPMSADLKKRLESEVLK